MNTLGTISSGLSGYVLTQIMPAILTVLGMLLGLVFAVYGYLKLLQYFSDGKSDTDVFYSVGRIFGDLVYANQYEEYAAERRHKDDKERQRENFDRDYFFEKYDRGDAVQGRDFY